MNFEAVEIIGDATVYLGDAREIVAHLKDQGEDIDARLGLSDIPYKLTSGGNNADPGQHIVMRGKFARSQYANDGNIVECDITLAECAGVLWDGCAIDADAIVMVNDKNVGPCWQALTERGWKVHNELVWDKIQPTANRWAMKNCEFAWYVWKGDARALVDCSLKQMTTCPADKGIDHPTPKPVALMERWITAATHPGELVFDPFMGSGSTGVAAMRTGRKFVGIEKDPKHFELAVDRIRGALAQGDLMAGVA
jgi:site-specific DNA-methyltransferase (adenine-specific)